MKYLSMSNLSGYIKRRAMQNKDPLEKKRKELELMLSVEHQMSMSSKEWLIKKLLDVIEEEMRED